MQELESLNGIFKNRLFRIPDYQRGYAWTNRQLTDFWEDVVNLPSERVHYTGLLSLKEVSNEVWSNWAEERWLIEERGFRPFHIVDGQQRLTTFVIFIQAIIELVKRLPEQQDKEEADIYLGSFSLKEIRRDYLVVEKLPEAIIKTYKFGYETDNPSFAFLRHRILNEPHAGSIQETFYTLNLENAKKFFSENLANFHSAYGLEEVTALFKKVTQNLKFNVYEISDDFDVFVAFETMNNRGKKLSDLELLKNRLIYLTTLYENEELHPDDRQALREHINDSWKEVYYELGRNKRNPLNDDDFLMAHWIMTFKYTREVGKAYTKFLLGEKFSPQNIYDKIEVSRDSLESFEEIRETDLEPEDLELEPEPEEFVNRSKLAPSEIKEYVLSLKSSSRHWYNIHNPINNEDLTDDESLWIDRLNRIGVAYFRPLITASFLAPNVDSADRVRLFKEIERFIFIAFRLCRVRSNYRNSEFYRESRRLLNGSSSIDDLIVALHSGLEWCFATEEVTDSSQDVLAFDYFAAYLQKHFQEGNGYYAWNGLRYFLYEYEMEKVRERGSQKIDWRLFVKNPKDKVSIEHIFPQDGTDVYWKDAFKGIKPKDRELYAGSLGNLVPLSMSINSSLQNDSFPEKKKARTNDRGEKIRQGYVDGSHSEIEVAAFEEWGPQQIKERGLKLMHFMERRWNLKIYDEQTMIDFLFIPEIKI